VNAPEGLVLHAARECGLNLLQFHGDESPEYCLGFGLMSMKAFRVRDRASLEAVRAYRTDAWLFDAYTPGLPGGTGETFNWNLARQARDWGRPIFLAGGLSPENIAEAIQCARPYGVDVSSGVEAAPGKKDHTRVKTFIEAAKAVEDSSPRRRELARVREWMRIARSSRINRWSAKTNRSVVAVFRRECHYKSPCCR